MPKPVPTDSPETVSTPAVETDGQATFSRSAVPAPFVHPAEAEFAAFLDFYRIRWQYEPKSFPLRWRDGGWRRC